MKHPTLVTLGNINVSMGCVLNWGSNHTKVGLEAWQQSKGLLLEVLELGGQDISISKDRSIERGILGASLDREVTRERDSGLLLGIDLGPVDHRIGTGWRDRRLQHNIILLLEAGPEDGELSGDNPHGSLGSFPLPLLGGLGSVVDTRGRSFTKKHCNVVNEFVTFVIERNG